MSIPVFTYNPSFTFKHSLRREFLSNKYTGGCRVDASSETAFSRSNGSRAIELYKGVNSFSVTFQNARVGSSNLSDLLWEFFLARLDNINEPFYFYNPLETSVIDLTGTSTIGRYLVKLVNPDSGLGREFSKPYTHSYTFEFEEFREFTSASVGPSP
jgi:hypothetical protein